MENRKRKFRIKKRKSMNFPRFKLSDNVNVLRQSVDNLSTPRDRRNHDQFTPFNNLGHQPIAFGNIEETEEEGSTNGTSLNTPFIPTGNQENMEEEEQIGLFGYSHVDEFHPSTELHGEREEVEGGGEEHEEEDIIIIENSGNNSNERESSNIQNNEENLQNQRRLEMLEDLHENSILFSKSDETDPLRLLFEQRSREQKERYVLENLEEKVTIEKYGFCDCCSSEELVDLLKLDSYQPIDLTFLGVKKYQLPYIEKNEWKSSFKIGDFACLMIYLKSLSSNLSSNSCSRFLKMMKMMKEFDGFKVNFPVTFKSLSRGLDEELEKRRVKILYCITCKERIHVFHDHVNNGINYKSETLPICPHCYSEDNMNVEKRIQVSPYYLKKSKLIQKHGHFTIFSPPTFFLNDVVKFDPSVRGLLNPTNVLEKMDHVIENKKSILDQMKNFQRLEPDVPQLLASVNLNADDVSSHNFGSNSKDIGAFSADFPFLKDFSSFSKVIFTSLSSSSVSDQKKWVVKRLHTFFYVKSLVYGFSTGYKININTQSIQSEEPRESSSESSEDSASNDSNSTSSVSGVESEEENDEMFRFLSDDNSGDYVRVRYVHLGAAMDKAELCALLKMKNSNCGSCRKNSTTDENRCTKWNITSGYERTVFSVVCGNEYEKDSDELRGFGKDICPLMELYPLYRHEYLKGIRFDILHRVQNIFNDVKQFLLVMKPFKKEIYKFIGSMKGKKKLLGNPTKFGYWKFEQKLNFFTLFVDPLLLYVPRGEDLDMERYKDGLSLLFILRKCFRLLHSNTLNPVEWEELWIEIMRKKGDIGGGIKFAYHDLFCHLVKGLEYKTQFVENKIILVFQESLIDILRRQSTERSESSYSNIRRLMTLGNNFLDHIARNLHIKNYSSIINGVYDRIIDRRVSNIMKSLSGGMKEECILVNEWTLDKEMGNWTVFELVNANCDVMISLLEFLMGELLWMDQSDSSVLSWKFVLDVIKYLQERMDDDESSDSIMKDEENPFHLLRILDRKIKIKEFKFLKKKEYPYPFSSVNSERKSFSSLRDPSYNSNIQFRFPASSLLDERGEIQDFDNDYFKHCGRILNIFEIKVEGFQRVFGCVVIHHHLRIGFLNHSFSFSTSIRKIVPDVQLVEMRGTMMKTVPFSFIIRHALLVKVNRTNYEYDVYKESSRVRSNISRESDTVRKPFRIVVRVPEKIKWK